MPYRLTMKPTFLTEWSALPAKESAQLVEKLQHLADDPIPDGKVRKKLKGWDKLYRLRCGVWRVVYSFEGEDLCVLALRRRNEATYESDDLDDMDGEVIPGFEPTAVSKPAFDWTTVFEKKKPKPQKRLLPRPVDADLLDGLQVPPNFRAALLGISNEEDLLDNNAVPEDLRLRVYEALGTNGAAQVLGQPVLVAESVDDLLRFKEGSLLGFLLRLNPEQEKYVSWGVNASGPTLLKGGPGTGKSTVALYRTRAMLQSLRKAGVKEPRLLFTTYTNALVTASEQLLRQLLGPDDAKHVEVRTADSLLRGVAFDGPAPTIAQTKDLRDCLDAAIAREPYDGNKIIRRSYVNAIDRLARDYLLEEILGVIEARALATKEDYLRATRPGRRLPLNATQRSAVWAVRDALVKELESRKLVSWQGVRRKALERIAAGKHPKKWDGLVIDEAQDLDPCVLRALVMLCGAPNRIFVTADANQSIYGAGFRWSDVADELKFTGRTGILRANHRSTREIGEAAQAYLAHEGLEGELIDREYVHTGPLPAVRRVASVSDELELLARFLPAAARELHQGLASCALLVPTDAVGQRLADALSAKKVPATFMTSRTFDLSRDGVKVLPLRSAKGLEFPVVAIGGFLDAPWPYVGPEKSDEERAEIFARERRTLFVAMTRAMRALLVVAPPPKSSPLLEGFEAAWWNVTAAA